MGDTSTDSGRADELRMLLSAPAVGVPHGSATEEERTTFAERRLAQREAYGQWQATGPIYWPGTAILCYDTGAQVDVEAVERWQLDEAGVVERVASPELARFGRRFESKAAASRWQAEQDEARQARQNEQQPAANEAPQGDTEPDQAKADTTTKGSGSRRGGK